MSPEGLAHAMDRYLESLKTQVEAAKAFYYGRLSDGVENIIHLPEHIRMKIDQLIWDASSGEAIDPTEEASLPVISAAILHSLEERMGFHSE